MNMAMDWQSIKLGDVAVFKTGKLDSNASIPDGKYPFFTCSHETFRTNTYSFDDECVLLAGNNANGIFPLKYFKGKFDAYQRTYVITTRHPSRLNTKYLYYALRPKLEEFRSISTGAATKFLTMGILNDTKIQLPPLITQLRIASILGAYDDLIEVNRRRIALLEEMARRLFDEWFVRFRFPGHEGHPMVETAEGVIPKGWQPGTLGDIAGLEYGRALTAKDRIPGEFPVIASSGIVGWHRTALVTGPGIIVGRKGNVGSIIWSARDFFPIDTVFYVEAQEPLRFLLYLLKTLTFQSSDVAVPGLNRGAALKMPIVIPGRHLMERFDQFADPLMEASEAFVQSNVRLAASRDLLLPRLISGELSVSAAERELEDAA